jgi:RND family efflux transporter MFP subunit
MRPIPALTPILIRACLRALVFAAAAFAGVATAQTRPADEVAPAGSLAGRTSSTADQVRVMLVAKRETTLSSATTARIKRLGVSMGVAFGKGQALVELECDEPEARLKMAKAELAGAQETLDARLRMQGLQQASDVEVALAAAAVSKARGQIDLYAAEIAQCTISAPWAGRVAKVYVKSHMSVAPGQPLVDLVMNGPLRLKLNLPSRLVGKLSRETTFNVTIDETGKSYPAQVIAVNSRVDSVSQTVEVEAAVTKAYPELLPGMSGVASLASLH